MRIPLPNILKRLLFRSINSPTIMSWTNQMTIFMHGLFVTTLLLIKFPRLEYSYWMYLKILAMFGLLAEAGFGNTIVRAVAYFYTGAKTLPRDIKEYRESQEEQGQPNLTRLRELLYTTRFIYILLSILTILLLSTIGIALLWENFFVKSNQSMVFWITYLLMVIRSFISFQSIKWRSFMTGTRHVAELHRFNTILGVVRIVAFILILLNNLGMLYLMAFTLLEVVYTNFYLRSFVCGWFKKNNTQITGSFRFDRQIFSSLWKVSWKSALNFWGYFLASKGIDLITTQIKDTAIQANYLFTVSILDFITGIAHSPVNVNYPVYYSYMAVKKYGQLKKEAGSKIFLTILIMVAGFVSFGLLGNTLLEFIGAEDKRLIGLYIYLIICTNKFLELHGVIHGTFYISTNSVPFLIPGLTTGVLSVVISFLIYPVYGLLGIVAVQLTLNMACNYWFAPYITLKLIKWPFKEYLNDIFFNGTKYWISRVTGILGIK
jgi:O-antigen/teichoic acid export membrane protein